MRVQRMRIDRDFSDCRLVIDGDDTGYRRAPSLESMERLEALLSSGAVRLYANWERDFIEPLPIPDSETWEEHYRHNTSFCREDSPWEYPRGYVYFAVIYEEAEKPPVVVLFYNH